MSHGQVNNNNNPAETRNVFIAVGVCLSPPPHFVYIPVRRIMVTIIVVSGIIIVILLPDSGLPAAAIIFCAATEDGASSV